MFTPGDWNHPYGQIMVTYHCSAACRHCLVMAAPQQDRALVTIDDAVQYGLDYWSLGRPVVIAGGEALLHFDHVVAMARAITEAGVPVAFVESNGSWCTSEELTHERLSALRDAGVLGMYFSIDCYHQEFVPAERVYRGVSLSWELFGPERVCPQSYSLEGAQAAERMAAAGEHLRQAPSGGIHFIGRAALDLAPLADLVPLDDLLSQNCRQDLDIDHLNEIQVDPFGFVRPDWCPGVNLGNTRHRRLAELCRTQTVTETPWLADLREHGPGALALLAQTFGIEPEPAYASKCHMCFELRRQLVRHMPDEFGPPHVYQVCPSKES